MPYLPCRVCGALSTGSRCPAHRSASARGYDSEHRRRRAAEIAAHPYCEICAHSVDPSTGRCLDGACVRCPLQLDHVVPMCGRGYSTDERRQVLCAVCNRRKSDH